MGRDAEKSPERPRRSAKRGRRSGESRRARLYLVELAWLEGYPDGDTWRLLDTDEAITVDGARISKARRAARTVLREHPVALEELVGDVERWWQIVDAKLAWLSERARVASTPPRSRPRSSVDRAPQSRGGFDPAAFLLPRISRALQRLGGGPLAEAANRVAIAWLTEPDRIETTLAWLDAHEAVLAPLAGLPHVQAVGLGRLACVLARLAVTGDGGKAASAREAGVAELIALVALDVPNPEVAIDVTRNVESRLLGQHPKTTPVPPRSGPKVVEWIVSLAQRDSATRQRALALIAPLRLAETLEPWQAWEREHAGTLARATALIDHRFEALDRALHVQRLIHKLSNAREHRLAVLSLADVIEEVDMLAGEPFIPFHPSIIRLVTAIPASAPVHTPARMLLHLARVAASTDDEHIEWLWDALANALEREPNMAILGPWHAALGRHAGTSWVGQGLVEDAKRRPAVERIVRLLVERARVVETYDRQLECIATWAFAGASDEVILTIIDPLLEGATQLENDVARAVFVVSDGTAKDIVALATAMRDVVEGLDWKPERNLAAFVEYEASVGAGWLVRGAILTKQRARLSEAADLVMSLPAARRPRFEMRSGEMGSAPASRQRGGIGSDPVSGQAWIPRYPAALATALRHLAMVTPDAEASAAKRLGDDLPDPADLEREIAALRARGATGSAAKRLANLEKRLAAPTLPSAARLANLAERIESTARDLGLAHLIAESTRIASERLLRTFGLEVWPDWAEPADRTQAAAVREILFALLRLESRDRELAGKLLRARGGPPPWDLRDEPANRRFLDRMRAAKLDVAAWLDTTPRTVKAARGEPVTLALADDPLDVFAMGRHFDTCLSPHGGNFFSVVANAADINKRVLYARRDGRVIGRCLFALTDGFALLTFQPYCHEQIEFPVLVRDFAVDLATRMRTTVAARGPVSKLLSRDWYDDGSRDLVGRFGGLDADLDIGAIVPDQLVATLREMLGRDLDEVTLPIVLGHKNLRGKPRHLARLVPFVLASNVSHVRIDAAQLALDNNDVELAARLLGEHARAIEIDEYGARHGELIARLRPSETLAVLRRTRRREVRRWSEDRAWRIAMAGMAFEALARPRKAATMYRLAAKTESWIEEEMHRRLAALGEPIEGEVAS